MINDISIELDNLFEKIKGNKKIFHFTENVTINELKKICDSSLNLVSILEFENNTYNNLYFNKNALEYFCVTKEDIYKEGFEYVIKTTHPDSMDSVYMLIKFYNDIINRSTIFSHTLYLNIKNEWKWIYSIVKPAVYNKDGTIKYLIAIACSLDDLLEPEQPLATEINKDLYVDNVAKYNLLSEREKEVLSLIAQELTSKEIADILFISPLTVDTHRKHLIEKLKVKSSIGLIKYAILFNLI